VCALSNGALLEDLDKSVDSAFPARADDGVIVASSQTSHLSESFAMMIKL
jgi:hypothetical protein